MTEQLTDDRAETEDGGEHSYHKRISVAASPATVFALLTEPDRLRRWQSVVSAVDLNVGGDYRHLVVPGAVARGEFTEIEPERRLVYTWGWEGEAGVPPGSSTVHIELQRDGDRTIIDFSHDGLPDEDAAISHAHGWDHFVDRLATAAETGDAGPDSWAAGPEDMDALAAAEASLALMLDLLRSSSADDLGRDTPCADFTVSELLGHLTGSMDFLATSAGASPSPPPTGADVEGQVAHSAATALTAWRDRGTEGTVEFAGEEAPASVPVAVMLLELFVHSWDLTQALDQPFDPADHLVDVADAATRGVVGDTRGDRFGPPLAEDGLDKIDALMAFTGRTI